MRALTILSIAAACSKPTAGPPPERPSPAPIVAADISKISLDSTDEWTATMDGDVRRYRLNTEEAFGDFEIWAWEPAWPSTAAEFERKLGDSGFLHTGFRYRIAEREVTPDLWLFRGVQVADEDGAQNPAFVMVRTINNARFLCMGYSQTNDDAEVATSIAGCRATRL